MHTSFIGIKAAQTREDFELWERFLTPRIFARIIEIGTYKWGLALFFFLWCKTKRANFYTYDIKFFPASGVVRRLGVTLCFKKANIFQKDVADEIADHIKQPGMSIVMCDGGNKLRELTTFSRYLKDGDYIAVHDWGTEVQKQDFPGLRLVAEGGMTAIFEKCSTAQPSPLSAMEMISLSPVFPLSRRMSGVSA